MNPTPSFAKYVCVPGQFVLLSGSLDYLGRPEGEAEVEYPDGTVYNGNFDNGRRNGLGCVTTETLWYKGMFKDDVPHGRGHMADYESGYEYRGVFVNGARQGQGMYCFIKDGYVGGGGFYEGQWMNDLPHGRGKGWNAEDIVFDGCWERGKMNGAGELHRIESDDTVTRCSKRFFENVSLF